MFKKIAAEVRPPYADWAKASRYAYFDLRDRLLDGCFYDHLPYSFYDELEPGTNNPIPIAQRRPSAQFRMLRMVARWSARKLFAGRHLPKVRHKDKEVAQRINSLVHTCELFDFMLEAVLRGSVGSVAMTFCVAQEDGATEPTIALSLWKAKFCWPEFDDMRRLVRLRVAMPSEGSWFINQQAPHPRRGELDAGQQFWFIRDFLPDREVTYNPEQLQDWNPVQGFTNGDPKSELIDWKVVEHGLGFVPGHWFTNLSGGEGYDGACTWEDAIPISIELDYLLSQASRGTRYNCAPQLVIKGIPLNAQDKEGNIIPPRGPMFAIILPLDSKGAEGEAGAGGAEAELLEMQGSGMEAALKLMEKLHDWGLEQISAPRKDPQKVKGALSGRAMERLDDDSHDLVMELRSKYGERGMLPLLRKILKAAYPNEMATIADEITLQWPRLTLADPDDILKLMQAFAIGLNPLAIKIGAEGQPPKPTAGQPPEVGKPAGGGGNGNTPPEELPEEYILITPEIARAILEANLDISMLDTEDQGEDTVTAGDKGTDPEDTGSAGGSGTGNTHVNANNISQNRGTYVPERPD